LLELALNSKKFVFVILFLLSKLVLIVLIILFQHIFVWLLNISIDLRWHSSIRINKIPFGIIIINLAWFIAIFITNMVRLLMDSVISSFSFRSLRNFINKNIRSLLLILLLLLVLILLLHHLEHPSDSRNTSLSWFSWECSDYLHKPMD